MSKQTGERCKNARTPGHHVCRFHGSKAGRPPTTGKYSKFLRSTRLREILESVATDTDLHDQTERLKVLDGLLIQYLERLGEASSGAQWIEAQKAFEGLQAAVAEGKPKAIRDQLASLERILKSGADEQSAEDRVREIIDQMASVSAVQIRLEYNRASSTSNREMAAFMARLEHGIKQFVPDQSTRRQLLSFLIGEISSAPSSEAAD